MYAGGTRLLRTSKTLYFTVSQNNEIARSIRETEGEKSKRQEIRLKEAKTPGTGKCAKNIA
jgi:hypothetical protein